MLLTADVGGTSSRIHLFRAPQQFVGSGPASVPSEDHSIFEKKYANEKWESLTDVIKDFLTEAGTEVKPMIACLAVAGAVVDNTCYLVNLGWRMDGFQMAQDLGIWRVDLINDFEAQGYGVLTLDLEQDVIKLQDVPVVRGAPMAVLGAGTGLGKAYLTVGTNGDYEVWPTEGGHVEFAPRQEGSSNLQFEMLQYLQIKFSAKSRISVERIVSGKGIANIYQFLAWKFPEKVNKDVHTRFLGPVQFKARNDPAPIVMAANAGECELSEQAVNMFVGAYAAECGVAALRFAPFGGLFITGGVTNKVREYITGEKGEPRHFIEAFLDKGRLTPMLLRIPVFVIRGEDMGERGVKLKACRMFQELRSQRKMSKGHMCRQVSP